MSQAAHQESAEAGPDQELGPLSKAKWQLLDPATRRKTFYKYERRIREFSQPDKVFHYFASRTLEDGTRQDFLTSYSPQPQSTAQLYAYLAKPAKFQM